eukprot:14744829-Alexandrium_andersonii.AAC.1
MASVAEANASAPARTRATSAGRLSRRTAESHPTQAARNINARLRANAHCVKRTCTANTLRT